jgi:hypothetical protein
MSILKLVVPVAALGGLIYYGREQSKKEQAENPSDRPDSEHEPQKEPENDA